MTRLGETQQTYETVDAVVVGSGFGGSVAALRLAEAGRSVVVMERGRAYPPGGFARTPAEMGRNFWDPDRGLFGLFDAWTFRGLEGLVSSGLGGGSLIYANVLLRKDPDWFVHDSPIPGGGYEHWPFGYDDLEPFYEEVERMLNPVPYPYQDTPKTMAMEAGAANLGLSISRPPLAVTFAARRNGGPLPNRPLPAPAYGSVHGERGHRTSCTLCGECDLGCNAGAKNTLDHTYLSAAKKAGADIRTLHYVRGIRALDATGRDGYEVRYVMHTSGAPSSTLREHVIRCRYLFLGAGTLGSSHLLLRNRASLPALSDALGSRFSGNGDLITFVMGAKIRGSDRPSSVRALTGSTGPVITTAIRVPDPAGGGRGFYVQDAGYPSFINWLIETGRLGAAVRRTGRVAGRLLTERLTPSYRTNISADLAAALGDGSLSASSLPLLGMGRDVPDGTLSIRDGRLAVDWTATTSEAYFGRVRSTMKDLAGELGGRFVDNPLWWAKRVITVHPLGGAPAGRHPGEGVCDAYGEVFGHPGLFVVDGAAMPGPVGANPALTIAAFAERACRRLLERDVPAGGRPSATADDTSPRDLETDATKRRMKRAARRRTRPAAPTPAAETAPETAPAEAPAVQAASGEPRPTTSVRFTEQMHGWFSPGESDPTRGHRRGRDRRCRIMFELTIATPDIDAFLSDPRHRASATGFVAADRFGGRMPVEQGWFQLFVTDESPDERPARRMHYRLWLRDPGGTPLTFTGFKLIHDDAGTDSWADTTTLHATIVRGHIPPATEAEPVSAEWAPADPASIVGAGILRIRPQDFARQLTTFRTEGPDPLRALGAFGRLFLGELWRVYGTAKGLRPQKGARPQKGVRPQKREDARR